MSILSEFKKIKRYVKESSGYKLLSQWTSSQTVEMDSGKTLQEEMSEKIDNTTVATISKLGLVKSGTDIDVDSDGNVSVKDNSHKHTVNNISDLTATADELNYTDGVTSNIQDQLDDKAPIKNPVLTGTPQAPTAPTGTNTTQIATTAFVQAAVDSVAQTNINGAITEIKSGDTYIDCTQTGSSVSISHKDVARTDTSVNSTLSSGDNFTAIKAITSDSKGHITDVETENITLNFNNSNIVYYDTYEEFQADLDSGNIDNETLICIKEKTID